MLKCDFNKVASAWVLSCKFAAYFLERLLQRAPLDGCFCSLDFNLS